MTDHSDILIIGSGMGGASLARAHAPSGLKITILERGDHMKHGPEARDTAQIFGRGLYRMNEEWRDGAGNAFSPGNYYYVGGNTKLYGAALIRYRAEDFEPRAHPGGDTPGWPLAYETLEPWYQQAEEMLEVRGGLGEDPTEPPHSGRYPFPPVPHEPPVADLAERLRRVGLHPSPIPLGIDIEGWLAGGQTGWDSFPGTTPAKKDAESTMLAAALAHDNVRLITNAKVERIAAENGVVTGVTATVEGQPRSFTATRYALAAGAVNSAALLLSSANEAMPEGLANRSDQVGRNFMNHNCSAVLALHPFRKNTSVYQKTLMVNDFYSGARPLGNIQMLGKITGDILASQTKLPRSLIDWITARSFDIYAMSEDLPSPDSRVTVKNGVIHLDWQRSNMAAHEELVTTLKRLLRKAGFPIVLSRPFDRRTPSHQCGTARMGDDPAASVVNTDLRSHDLANLYITDASVLPTSAAVNPSLTIAALSLRAGKKIAEEMA
ncbi:FAD-dependent oxidoreductase [Paracoccaceae bacterium GXU_MW_L88]